MLLEAGTDFSASLLTAAELVAIALELAALSLVTLALAAETAFEVASEVAAEPAAEPLSEAAFEVASEVAAEPAAEPLSEAALEVIGAPETVSAEAVLLTFDNVKPAKTAVVARPAKTMFFLALYIL